MSMAGYILEESVLAEMREWAENNGVTSESTLVLEEKDLGCFIRINAGVIQRWLIEAPESGFSEWLGTKPLVTCVTGTPWSPRLEEAIYVLGWRVVLLLASKFTDGDVVVMSDARGDLEVLSM